MVRYSMLALVVVALVFAACSQSPRSSTPQPGPVAIGPSPAPSPSGASPAVSAQIGRGAGIYAASCARCHGAAGEGSAASPALLGAAALPSTAPAGRQSRTGSFNTAMDIGMYVMQNMPPDANKLPPADVAAVLAWLLDSHGATPGSPINPSVAGMIRWNR